MGTVDGTEGGVSESRKPRWRRFFSCACLSLRGEAETETSPDRRERAAVPATEPVDLPAPTVTASAVVAADPPLSVTRDADVPRAAAASPDQSQDTQVTL